MLSNKNAEEKLSQGGVTLSIRGIRTEVDIFNQVSPKTSLEFLSVQISGGSCVRQGIWSSRCKGPGAQSVQEEQKGQ